MTLQCYVFSYPLDKTNVTFTLRSTYFGISESHPSSLLSLDALFYIQKRRGVELISSCNDEKAPPYLLVWVAYLREW